MFLYDLMCLHGCTDFLPLTVEKAPSVSCQFHLVTHPCDPGALLIQAREDTSSLSVPLSVILGFVMVCMAQRTWKPYGLTWHAFVPYHTGGSG